MTLFYNTFSEEIWKTTYKHHTDNTVDDTIRRQAKCFASIEKDPEHWEEVFYNSLSDFKVVPGGRIMANAGTEWTGTTFFNCFTGYVPDYNLDSIEGIYKVLYAQAQTLKSEGGWGLNFSFIRPRGSFIEGIGVESPGAVAFMELFDKSSEIITSGSGLKSSNSKAKGKIRKGAQMAILNCESPDVLEFITAKQTPGRLTKFNMSVNFSNKFMDRLIEIKELQQYPEQNKDQIEELDKWDLIFPVTTHPDFKEVWNGDIEYWQSLDLPIKVYNTISIQGLWNLVMNSTYNRAEPGVLFMDQFNKDHLLNYLGTKYKIFSTNPCFTGDMKLLTSEGYKSFKELCGTEPEIINYMGNKSQSKVWCSGKKNIIQLEFENKNIKPIKCTPNHTFLVDEGEMVYEENASNLIGKYVRLFNQDTKTTKVISIKILDKQKVYDFTEPLTHWGIVNGVVAHNCSEQGMPNANSCDLGVINLTQFVNIPNRVFDYSGIYQHTRVLVRILDNVNTISDAPEWYLDAIRNRRRIGCGVMGWGSALYMLQVRFGSEESSKIQEELMKVFSTAVLDESIELARIRGSFKECNNEKIAKHSFLERIGITEEQKSKIRQYGIRNSSLFSIQPNGNSSVLCNLITGGCEPLFGHGYIRTVIVPECPENLREYCPKYWEKQFHETSIFKLNKEGDEEILRGEFEGIIYKIDKSRGLTKEVWCEDYSISKLKELNLWDSQADWAVTSQDLTVEEHIDDLKGFCKYLDASCSKTISVPNSYSLEDFENVYLNAYKSGIKGITTYRAGTMLSVLSISTEKKSEELKRPENLSCDIYRIIRDKEIWYIFIGLKEGKPYEIFAGTSQQDVIPSKLKIGIIKKIKHGKVKPATYNLICEDFTVEDIVGTFSGELFGIQTRLISALLRNEVDIEQITKQLQKDPTPSLHTFFRVVSRVLKKYISDGTVSKQVCSECSGELIFQEGCFVCKNCGYSKCN